MNKAPEPVRAPAEQTSRRQHRALRLEECGDTLGVVELCGVLGIGRSEFYRMKAHRCLPVKPLPQMRNRFSAIQVRRFLERGA